VDLVTIQPQKATRVRPFSEEKITTARFVRQAIEIDVAKNACKHWSAVFRPGFERCLEAQDRAMAIHDPKGFHVLDEEFHGLLTEAAQAPFAFEQIKLHKAYVDRICVLSLKDTDEMAALVADHWKIFEAVAQQDAVAAEAALREHFARIERTIEAIRQANSAYFED
jgi:DNA-binding GntR family transcriptional regulator